MFVLYTWTLLYVYIYLYIHIFLSFVCFSLLGLWTSLSELKFYVCMYSSQESNICKLMYALNLKETIDKSTTHNDMDLISLHVCRSVHPMGEMTHVASLIFQGGGQKLLEMLHNVMQRTVGHDQRAYSTNML